MTSRTAAALPEMSTSNESYFDARDYVSLAVLEQL